MNQTRNQLSFELLEYPSPSNPHPPSHPQPPSTATLRNHHSHLLPKTKKAMLCMLVVGFVLYRWLFGGRRVECVSDLLHEWTGGVNWLLHHNDFFYQLMLIIAQ